MRKPIIAALIAACASMHAQAADLLQVYKEALANDAQFASSRSSLAAGQERLPQARAGLLPTVGLTAGYSRSTSDTSASGFEINSPNFGTSSYTLSLAQPLFRWANWETYQQGKLSVAASEAQFALAQQDLIIRVATAYFDVLAGEDGLQTLQAQKTAIAEQLASAKRNFEVGTATITDTHEAQARYDLVIAQEIAAANEIEIRRNALRQIIGRAPGDLAKLRTDLKLPPPEPAQMEKWVTSAEQQNFGVVQQQLAVEIAQREIGKSRAGHYPTVDLVASRSYSNPGWTQSFPNGVTSNSNAVGVQLAIPIFSGYSVTSRVRETIALEDKARSDLENVRRTSAQSARQAFLGVSNGLAEVRALEAAEVSSQSALDSNQLGYQVGVRINIDVLNSQQQLYQTRANLARARYLTIINGLRLKFAAGTLTENDLVQVNTLLNH